jgi:K+-transporting ATPase KdpF subunit
VRDARPLLRFNCGAVFRRLLGLYKSLRPALGRAALDYIIAGVAALFLFGYLVYALLRPERF